MSLDYHPEIIEFSKIISGKYSNFLQSQEDSKNFPHIKLFIRMIDSEMIDGMTFYSEQSYDYAPWTPYRQAIQQLRYLNNTLVISNYKITNLERYAGGGENPSLLKGISKEKVELKCGCNMIFKKIKKGKYIGNIESGKKCLIKKNNKLTYLFSRVEIDSDVWKSLDEGYDQLTNKKIWGSYKGPFILNKY